MKHFQASAVERRIYVHNILESHPMEVGWASEALFFLVVEDVAGENPQLDARVEISADGINWIPEGTAFEKINTTGHYFARVSHFGNWLRVYAAVSGDNAAFKLSVHLHLKE